MFKALDQLGDSMPHRGPLLSMFPGSVGTTPRMEYVRVWRAHYSMFDVDMIRDEDEPCGVARIDPDRQFWIRMDGKWLQHKTRLAAIQQNEKAFKYEIVSQAEFESDLAFGLWSELKVTYRPVRTTLRRFVQKWGESLPMTSAICLGIGGGILSATDGDFDFVKAIGVGFISVGFLAAATMLVNSLTGHDKIKNIEKLLGK